MFSKTLTQRVSWFLICSLLVLIPLFYVPGLIEQTARATLLVVFVFTISVFTLFATTRSEWRLFYKKNSIYILCSSALILSVLISTAFSPVPLATLLGADRGLGVLPQISCVLFGLLLIKNITTRTQLSSTFSVLFFPVSAVVLFGLVQRIVTIPRFEMNFFEGRVDSLLSNPNNLALFLLLVLPIVFYYAVLPTKQSYRILIMRVLFVLIILNILLTGSRTATALMFVQLLVCGVSYLKIKTRKLLSRSSLTRVAVCVLFAVVVSLSLPAAIRERYSLTDQSLLSLQTRVQLWGDSVSVIAQSPVFGFGPESYREAFYIYSDSELIQNPLVVDRAHNFFIDLLVERGIVGFFISVFFFCFLAFRSFSLLKEKHNNWGLILPVALSLISYYIFLLMNFTDVVSSVYAWFLIAAFYLLTTPLYEHPRTNT